LERERRCTLLITGGCGFIGSNFIRHILDAYPDWTVINLDKLTYAGNPANLADVEAHPNYRFVQGDVADRVLVGALFAGEHVKDLTPSVVVNFAAESHVDRSILDSAPFIETNVKGTQVLLDAARAHWSPDRDPRHRFLQISTDEVYGSIEEGACNEDAPLRPNSPYAASKAAADLLCRAYRETYDLPVIVTRACNNYGPFQFPEKLIPLMTHRALSGESLPVYGDGTNVREWLHVEDHCRALEAVLQRGEPGEVYNVGSGEELTNLALVERLCDLLKARPETQGLRPTIEFVKDRLGHDRRYALDASKLAAELAWEPRWTLEAGLAETIAWYVAHEEWVAQATSGEFPAYYRRAYAP